MYEGWKDSKRKRQILVLKRFIIEHLKNKYMCKSGNVKEYEGKK